MLAGIMRLLTLFFFLLITFLKCGSQTAIAQDLPGSQQVSTDATSNLTWKATLMTGDDRLDVFDNARKTLKSEFLHMGVTPANIKELSMNPVERKSGSLPSSAVNLAGALRELSIGDQDACLIHMTSHGSPQGFYLRNASPITPQMLDRILDVACSERPTVVLISACYSGVFVGPSMQKKNRIILTAARQDRTSFGCSAENQYTYWDSCLINSLPTAESWRSLYGIIQQCVQTKESQGHFKPSLPQAYFGEDVLDLKIPKTVPAAFNVLSKVNHGYDRNDASRSKEPVSRLPRNASRHDRTMPRRTVDQQRLSQPILADRLPRAVLHAFLPPAECGFLSSMGTSPDWNSIHG
jgi:Peptidase C13 family